MFRLMGLFTIIPATLLLTISFFVLLALRKAETQGLKVFGYVVSVLLWAAAVLVLSAGIYTLSTGRPACPMMANAMCGKGMMSSMKGGPMQGMMEKKMSGMMQEEGCGTKAK